MLVALNHEIWCLTPPIVHVTLDMVSKYTPVPASQSGPPIPHKRHTAERMLQPRWFLHLLPQKIDGVLKQCWSAAH